MAQQQAFLDSDVLTAEPETWPLPQEVAGIKLPDSTLARGATDFTRAVSAPVVFNHVLRSYLFGELLGRAKGLEFDHELFYLGAVLHDLGLTERFMGQERFEVDGADAAAEFLKDKGAPKEWVEVVWDAVALPPRAASSGASSRKSLWSARGPWWTFSASELTNSPKEAVVQVIAEFPRMAFKKEYQKVLDEVVARKRKPETTSFTFLADIGERYVPGYHAPNFCDLMNVTPFAD
jgi:hypothetical protein